MLLTYLAEKCAELPVPTRRPLWLFLHYLLRRFDRDDSSVFLNYGFAHRNGNSPALDLDPGEEEDRNAIQLYHHVTEGAPLESARILEVGCGRGGGAAYLARRRRPAEYVGLDISAATTAFCNRVHQVPGLSFVQGEAERLRFPDGHFDVVINVESARCYGGLGSFFRGVFRVLKPGGHFLFADVFKRGTVEAARRKLNEAGFLTLRASDIREHVLQAMIQDSPARSALIDSRVPRFMRRGFYEVSATTNSRKFRAFAEEELDYWSFVLRKPDSTSRTESGEFLAKPGAALEEHPSAESDHGGNP